MYIRKTQIFKFLAIVCFFLIIRNLLLLKLVQPIGYVIDIYSMFPFTFYLSLISCYFISIFLIFYNYKKLGIFILCINHLEILLIPYMLGYYSMGRADDMYYIYKYFQITKFGYFTGGDIYPASHIIGAFISLLSNIEVHNTSFIIPIIFSFIFIIGLYLFSKELISEPFICSLVIVSSFILYMGIYNFLNTAHALFFAFMPLYLCYFHKHILNPKSESLSITFVLMTLVIPLTHPFIMFFLFSIFLLHLVPIILSKSPFNVLKIPRIKMSSFLLLVVGLMGWFVYSLLWYRFKQNYVAFVNQATEPVVYEKTIEKFSKIHLDFFDCVKLTSFFYGRYIIPTIFIIISFILLYRNRKFLKMNMFKEYPYLVILYFSFILLQGFLLFNPLISHQPDRITNLNFIVYSQVPLFACALYLIFFKDSIKFRKILQVCGILTFIWSLSLFGCFDSPNVYRENVAVTYNEANGVDWFIHMKDDSIIIAPISQMNRFFNLLGYPEEGNRFTSTRDHFGYVNESDTFKNINLDTGTTAYVVILTVDELVYQKVPGYMTIGRYTYSDFVRFRKDISLNKIYDSLNIEIFKSV